MKRSEEQFDAPFSAIVTTIQLPTKSLTTLSERVLESGGMLFVVGDRKTPSTFELPGARFYSLDSQLADGGRLAEALPEGHYSRKNLGYLEAIRHGVRCIYETDDDNAPMQAWTVRDETARTVAVARAGWVNVYRHFTAENVWPRGLPLDEVRTDASASDPNAAAAGPVRAPIQQGLANGEPDVDAIWRLTMPREVMFEQAGSILLPPGAWCPFNSQSTWWFPVAYPLLYLPSHCSFRMTDIWRSFVAQRCLWELGLGVVFHGPEVVQERNVHNLLRDFEQEVPGYLGNRRLAATLERVPLRGGEEHVAANVVTCYEALVREGFFPIEESRLLELWVDEVGQAISAERAKP